MVEKLCLIAGGMGAGLKSKFIRMIDAGKHRGKDSFGVWTDEGILKSYDFSEVHEIPDGKIGLLQCRLAIIGSLKHTQPFVNELALVHNGEIYNHVPLRDYLRERGMHFESDVDSEVILRLIEYLLEKGLSMQEAVRDVMFMLNGDYSVAFSDGRRIYLFRDPVGIRPLYYSPGGFFASEKKVLWSIGEEAYPVRPGHLVEISADGIKVRRLFDLKELKGKEFGFRRAEEALMKNLDYSTRIRSTRKTGILFSGGLDSSLLALLASKYSNVVLYTAGAEGSVDLEWARKVSEILGLPLREFVFDIEDVEEAAERVIFAIEEPNAMNLSIGIPLYFATKLASGDGIKVLLSGQGADELFGGYHKYLKNPGLMENDLGNMGERNLARDDKIAMLNGVEGRFPFLDLNIIRVALRTPLESKIRGGVRKYILRQAALKLGLSEEVAMREKKACQYGTNSQKLLEKIAKKHGMRLSSYAQMTFERLFKQN